MCFGCVHCTVEKYAHRPFRGCWGLFLQVKRYCVVSHVVRERGTEAFLQADACLTFPVNQNHVNITTHTRGYTHGYTCMHNSPCTQLKPEPKEKLSKRCLAVGEFVVMALSALQTIGLKYSNRSQLVSRTSVISCVSVEQLELQTAQGNQGFNHRGFLNICTTNVFVLRSKCFMVKYNSTSNKNIWTCRLAYFVSNSISLFGGAGCLRPIFMPFLNSCPAFREVTEKGWAVSSVLFDWI